MANNSKDIKRRITSVQSTQKITNAMKLVSAAKFARASHAVQAARPYANAFDRMVSNLLMSGGENLSSPLLRSGKEQKSLLVIMSTDRGLCGALNTNLFKVAQKFLQDKTQEGVDVELFPCGRRAISFAKKLNNKTIGTREKILDKPNFERAVTLGEEYMGYFTKGEYDHIYVAHVYFKSALEQIPQVSQILPVMVDVKKNEPSEQKDFIVEPDIQGLLDSLLSKKIYGSLFRMMLDGAAAEHGARMTAMDSATNNAKQVIKKLTLKYNRARQAQITTELTEIISGAEALN